MNKAISRGRRRKTETAVKITVKTALAAAVCAVLLAGCAVGPDYTVPETEMTASFKEDALWKTAKPADRYPKGAWWKVFKDPELDRLMDLLNSQNLTVKQAEAQYRQALALQRQAESALFPTFGMDAGRTRSRTAGKSGVVSNTNTLSGTVSWEADVWGGIRRNVEASEAAAQASFADLASARLSAQAQLASSYLELVVTDRQITMLEESEKILGESLRLTENQYKAGTSSDEAVAEAESLYKTAQAATVDSKLARAQLEHAIAVAIGKPPAAFSLPRASADPYLPQIPAGIPSLLLQRRPDIASAERKAAEANALIGVAKSAFFPSLTLSATGGWQNSSFGNLLMMPSRMWSIGPSIALTIFDAGLRRAQTDEAIAAYDEAVAAYRLQVLTAFQEVEDYLAAQAMLSDEADMQGAAFAAARRAEQITLNKYKAGVSSYLEVITAQNSRISAENTLWDIRKRQFTSCVSLIAAIGGQWDSPEAAQPDATGKKASPGTPEKTPAPDGKGPENGQKG